MEYRKRIYDKYASNFQNASKQFDTIAADRQSKAYEHYFRGWLPGQKSADIVDLACGSGFLLYFFGNKGYSHLSGVDISSEQVYIARQVVPGVVHADAMDFLSSKRDAFDLITGLNIIEHFIKGELLSFFDLCHNALRPNGRIILQTINGESPFCSSVRYGDFSHELCVTPDSLLRLLTLCGFSSVEVREQGPIPWGYSLKSSFRAGLWQAIRIMLRLWNMIECGSAGKCVFTRVFLASGVK